MPHPDLNELRQEARRTRSGVEPSPFPTQSPSSPIGARSQHLSSSNWGSVIKGLAVAATLAIVIGIIDGTRGRSIVVGTFTSDESPSGCGMTLWKPERSSWNEYLFFHGMGDDPAVMMFNSEITRLRRTAASGEEFYGQQTAQTFMTTDGMIIVHVDATLGAPGEIESISIPDATISIEVQGQTEAIHVVGDAGC